MVVAESHAKTNKEQLDFQEETIYDVLIEVNDAMVDSIVHVSLLDTPMVGSTGANIDVTPGNDIKDQCIDKIFLYLPLCRFY